MENSLINIIINIMKYDYELILDEFVLKATITLPILQTDLSNDFWYQLFDRISYKINSNSPRTKNIDLFINHMNERSYGWIYLKKKWCVYLLPQTIIIWKLPHYLRSYIPIIN